MENKAFFSLHDFIKSLEYWVRILLKNWILISIFFVIGISAGVYYSINQKPQYEAEVVFSLESGEQNSLGSYASIASQFGLAIGGGGGGAFVGDNLMELLQLKKMTEKTLFTSVNIKGKKQLLIDYFINFNEINKSWYKDSVLKNINFSDTNQTSREKDSVLNNIVSSIIKSSIKVDKIDKNLDYLSLKIVSNDELFSKDFSEKLIENTIDFYREYKSKKAAQNLAIFQKQLDSVKSSMYNSIENIAVVNDLNINPLKNVSRVDAQKKQVRLRTEGELVAELEKNLELSKIALTKETPLIQIIDTPRLPLTKTKMGKLKGGILFGFLFAFIAIIWVICSSIFQIQKVDYLKENSISEKNNA